MKEPTSLDSKQFVLTRSEFLADPAFSWVSMGETRRVVDSDEPMSGSVALSDAVIDQGLSLQFGHLTADELLARRDEQRTLAANRIETLRRMMGLTAFATLLAVHGLSLIDVDAHMPALHHSHGASRPSADAAVSHTPGHGILINPADCPVATLIHAPHDPERRAVAQIHAGWRGLAGNIIARTIPELVHSHGFKVRDTFAYVQPHASSDYTVHGEALELIKQSSGTMYLKPLETLDDAPETALLDMTGMVEDQLYDAGIRDGHLHIDRTNSMTDDTLYSHRAASQKGFAGRNALAVGIRADQLKYIPVPMK